jgi:hypothetical protein
MTVLYPDSSLTITSPVHTDMVRPGLTTRPIATNSVPLAGARKLTLYSIVKTSD